MKKILCLFIFIACSCNGQNKNQVDICWDGFINNKIPVFIHYSIVNELVIGEITYQNTKEKKPIKLIGTIQDKNSYRLLEFDNFGNITGILLVTPNKTELNGTWISPKTGKELKFKANKNEIVKIISDYKSNHNDIFGDYYYNYGKFKCNGNFNLIKNKNNLISFDVMAMGDGEVPNLAIIERDSIKLTGNSFIYKMPDTENCRFKINFYKDFVYVKDLGGDCTGQFGMGAYIDGIYFKTK
ncbi:MAG: hypothetical protein V4548_02735 [Bacteroidota bacterium]